jgi:hypothetical protein
MSFKAMLGTQRTRRGEIPGWTKSTGFLDASMHIRQKKEGPFLWLLRHFAAASAPHKT